ncbi:hypothetical protein EIP86_002680 [Pleurotus ostreatoroseus]|nr:hypothetical protein EIP86_002680 [Pleurotus ostreatoroseus]
MSDNTQVPEANFIALFCEAIMHGTVTGSLLLHAYATSPISSVLYDPNTTMWVEIFGAVTFSANLYAIGIIAFKAWEHERALNGVWFREGRFHRALLIVIESGAVYCLTLVIIMILIAAGDDFGVVIVIDILAHLTGIYPSIILVLVAAKLAYADEVDRSIAFASIRFNQSRGGPRPAATRGLSDATSAVPEPVEVDMHMRTSRPETSSKPFIGGIEDVGSMTLGECSLQVVEVDERNIQEV